MTSASLTGHDLSRENFARLRVLGLARIKLAGVLRCVGVFVAYQMAETHRQQ